MAGGPLYFSMVEVMKAKPPAKSRAGQRRLISLVDWMQVIQLRLSFAKAMEAEMVWIRG